MSKKFLLACFSLLFSLFSMASQGNAAWCSPIDCPTEPPACPEELGDEPSNHGMQFPLYGSLNIISQLIESVREDGDAFQILDSIERKDHGYVVKFQDFCEFHYLAEAGAPSSTGGDPFTVIVLDAKVNCDLE